VDSFIWPMLSVSLVTMAYCILRLQDGKASRYEGYLRMYWICSCVWVDRLSSSLDVGQAANNSPPLKSSMLQNVTQDLKLGWMLWYDLSN
jgi:hypothetical protein